MQDLSKIRAEPTEATGRSQCPGFSEQICCPWLTASSVCVCTAVSGKAAGPGCHSYEHTGPGLGVLVLGAPDSSNLVPRRRRASDEGAHPHLPQPLGSTDAWTKRLLRFRNVGFRQNAHLRIKATQDNQVFRGQPASWRPDPA